MSSSPVSIANEYSIESPNEHALSLDEFVDMLPTAIGSFDKSNSIQQHAIAAGSDDDPIMQLFKKLNLTDDWWKRYAFIDPTRNYTRNLVATDSENYTLILMCWNPNQESAIHNHPCKGCWVRVIQGSIQEHRYIESSDPSKPEVESEDGNRLILIADGTLVVGQATLIKDSQGYHKLGNPSNEQVSVTLHLYCPPYHSCKYWLDVNGEPLQGTFPLYSEFGRKLE